MTARDRLVDRAWKISHEAAICDLAMTELKKRLDEWATEAGRWPDARLPKERPHRPDIPVAATPGIHAWDTFTVPMSMREVEPGVNLVMEDERLSSQDPIWRPRPTLEDDADG